MARRFAALPFVLVLTVLLVAPAASQARSDIACDLSVPVELSPGISPSPSGGELRSSRTGKITCVGEVGGELVAGDGWVMRLRGAYGVGDYLTPPGRDDCARGQVRGTFSARLRKAVSFIDPEYVVVVAGFEASRTGSAWALSGRIEDPIGDSTAFSSALDLISDQDCVTAPVTQGVLRGQLATHGPANRIGENGTWGPGDQAGGAEPAPRRCATRAYGSRRRDRLEGTPAGDFIRGRGGADMLDGLSGDDCLFGDGGGDRLEGGSGGDALVGGSGRDLVMGEGGDDFVAVADGRADRVDCGPGRDRVAADKRDRVMRCEQVTRASRTGQS